MKRQPISLIRLIQKKLLIKAGLLVPGILMLLLLVPVLSARAQVGVHTDFPDNSSAMDIVSTTKGLLIPRVTLSNDLTSPSPVTAPAVGLLVFNSGANQPLGFYYWDGAQWVELGSGGGGGTGDYWSLYGNTGTTPGTNFLGTTDAKDLIVSTNSVERMRVEQDGQVLIGLTTPYAQNHVLTAAGNAVQNYAIYTTSPNTGVYAEASYAALWAVGGTYGLLSRVTGSAAYAILTRNLDANGYAILTAGSNQAAAAVVGRSAGICSSGSEGTISMGKSVNGWGVIAAGSNWPTATLVGRSAGVSAVGNDGAFASAKLATGRGIIAGGSATVNFYTSLESEGGAFTGHHGVFARTTSTEGVGVIGIGSATTSYPSIPGGSGGSFSGNLGVYAKGTATDGIGIIAIGNNGSTYYTVTGGSGGSFTGNHGLMAEGTNATDGTGVVGAGNGGGYTLLASGSGGAFTGTNAGVAGFGSSSSASTGVVGTGNSYAPELLVNGSGGAFTGNDGVYAKAALATGTGLIGAGNGNSGSALPNGSGGAFVGNDGVYAKSALSTGTGVLGVGNNLTAAYLTTGSGGAFNGNDGVYAKATLAAGTGVIGAGNNGAYSLHSNGSGGAFTGYHGTFSKATNATTGTGVFGIGNNSATFLTGTNGGGGAFTGTYNGVSGWATLANDNSVGVLGQYNGTGSNNDGIGVKGVAQANSNRGYGVYGQGLRYGVYSNGNMGASGSKPFVIDHPLDPENKILRHFAIESPEILNMYRGNVILNADGEATVQLPDYFHAININFSYDLTPIGSKAPDLYIKEEIDNEGRFVIAGGNPNQKVSWVVYADRNDLFVQREGERDVEVMKEEHQRGKYIMPELFGQPPEKGMFYSGEPVQLDVQARQDVLREAVPVQIQESDRPVTVSYESSPVQIRSSESQAIKAQEDKLLELSDPK